VGCRNEAIAALEDALDIPAANSMLRAALLTNLGALYTETDQTALAASRLRNALQIASNPTGYESEKVRLQPSK
jgi:hypothetical protein